MSPDVPEPRRPSATSAGRGRFGPRRLGIALAALLLGAGAFALGWTLHTPQLSAVGYGMARIHAINAHLDHAPPGYVLLAGDSYMEFYPPEPLPCGREIVNGGVGGMKAEEYVQLLDFLRLKRPPAAVLISVGLNNLLKKKDPRSRAALDAFRGAADSLVTRLSEGGAPVTFIAIPPVPASMTKHFEVEAIAVYTQALRDVCAARGCTVRDVFADVREGDFWRTKQALALDGFHLSNLRHYYRQVYADLCR